ncbi:CU044_5270 family protein [Actinoplanes sp. NPDC049596]|uniref:CU044_5270 family protein n=1 Tax=unclassified Actinoplanes TaxID=2626549 RepID=UPI00341EB85B
MDEITLTRELGRGTPLPSPDRLAPARARLLAELTADSAQSPGETSPQTHPRRLTRRVLALAAAVAVVVAGATTTLGDRGPETPPVATVPVAQFLDTAAAVAGKEQDVVPRGDQFVYAKTIGPDGTSRESWYSVDGRHDGLARTSKGAEEVIPGCIEGRQKGSDSTGQAVQVSCEPEPHVRPDLPTDPSALITWLTKRSLDKNGKRNVNGVAKDMWSLSDGYWLRPAQRAALYRAAGMIDGISLVPNSKDSTGRTGTGVAWTSPGESEPQVMWIFDATTHVLLGSPLSSLVTPPLIVDEPGQRP